MSDVNLSPNAVLKKQKEDLKPLAILVMHDPSVIAQNSESAEAFYTSIENILRSKGLRVRRDPGDPGTAPEPADLWIGHGSGIDCLHGSAAKVKLLLEPLSFDFSARVEKVLNQAINKLDPTAESKKILKELIRGLLIKL